MRLRVSAEFVFYRTVITLDTNTALGSSSRPVNQLVLELHDLQFSTLNFDTSISIECPITCRTS